MRLARTLTRRILGTTRLLSSEASSSEAARNVSISPAAQLLTDHERETWVSNAMFNFHFQSLEIREIRKHIHVPTTITGRVRSIRKPGRNLTFLDVYSDGVRVQVKFGPSSVDEHSPSIEEHAETMSRVRLFDIVCVTGFPRKDFKAMVERDTVLSASSVRVLSPYIRDKYAPQVTTPVARWRDPVFAWVSNGDKALAHIRARAKLYSTLRAILDARDFVEVETPVLWNKPGGASALPFVTQPRQKAFGELSMRVAPELFLKQLVIGGLNRVYEIGKQFRNESVDATHNPEFTTLEMYQAYSDTTALRTLTESLVREMVRTVEPTMMVAVSPRRAELRDGDANQPFGYVPRSDARYAFIPRMLEKQPQPRTHPSDGAATSSPTSTAVPTTTTTSSSSLPSSSLSDPPLPSSSSSSSSSSTSSSSLSASEPIRGAFQASTEEWHKQRAQQTQPISDEGRRSMEDRQQQVNDATVSVPEPVSSRPAARLSTIHIDTSFRTLTFLEAIDDRLSNTSTFERILARHYDFLQSLGDDCAPDQAVADEQLILHDLKNWLSRPDLCPREFSFAQCLDAISSSLLEPLFVPPTFLTQLPTVLSPLAQSVPDRPYLADRFELFIGGREIANGYQELTDPREQHRRFLWQARDRLAGDAEAQQANDEYVNSLRCGLPPTVGLGIGIDRVMMLATQSPSIRDVLSFPLLKPLKSPTPKPTNESSS